MQSRSFPVTLAQLKASSTLPSQVISPETRVMDAIAQMAGMAAPSDSPGVDPTLSQGSPGKSPLDSVLVQEDGKLVGILTSQDVMRLVVQQLPLEQLIVGQAMSHPVITLRESEFVDTAAAISLLQQHRIRHLPLVDGQDRFVGLLTAESLFQAALAQVPEEEPQSVLGSPSSKLQPSPDLLAAAPVGVFWTDALGLCLSVSARWCEIVGLTPAAALGEGWQAALHPDDRGEVAAEWEQSARENRPFQLEYRFQTPEGKVSWVHGQAIAEYDATGQVIGYVGTITDISDRKAAEMALHHVIAGTAATTGQDFFPALVGHLAQALNVAYVLVSERVNDELNVLAYWAKGVLRPNFSFPLAGTPCEQVLQAGRFDIPSCLQEQFPTYLDLAAMGAESYLGVAIRDAQGQAVGNLCILDSHAIANPEQTEQLLTVFAARAAAELERQRASELLKQLNAELEAKIAARTHALQERKQFLRTVLDAFPLAIFWKDRNSVYLGCNRVFQQDAGLASTQDIVGRTDDELPWGDTQAAVYREDDQFVIQSETAKLGIVQLQRQADGQQIWLETNKVPLRSLDGEIVGILGTYQDVTLRRQAELVLLQTNEELARATRLKDEFLANMSHELRTPLNAILGMTEGLQDHVFGDVNEQQTQALQTIARSSTHLLELINDILDVAKIEAGQAHLDYGPTGITGLCESSLAFIKHQAQKKCILLELTIPPDLPIFQLDGRRIRQVLINLLSNAVKFTPEQGRITLAVSPGLATEEGEESASLAQPDWLCIAVRDTGIGIAPENLDQLFQPFVQIDSALNRQYQGTGLGLALVKRIVELHGGYVSLASELTQGSCFTIHLPWNVVALEAPEQEEPEREAPITVLRNPLASRQTGWGQSQSSEPLRILLVEDQAENSLMMASYLEAQGCQVLVAKDGLAAIAQAQAELPDLILMDIQMPGMDGLEAIKQIRLNPNLVNIPIIALTALAMTGDRERCLAAGANEYLSKPVKLRQLANTIQQLLATSTESPEA